MGCEAVRSNDAEVAAESACVFRGFGLKRECSRFLFFEYLLDCSVCGMTSDNVHCRDSIVVWRVGSSIRKLRGEEHRP